METQAITIFAKWQVKEGQLEFVLEALQKLADKSRTEADNLLYRVHQSQSDSHSLHLYEIYQDEEAVEAHRNSSHFQELALKTIVPLLEKREVSITKEIF